ncbi:bifunctional epoxide hydrolase 2 [Quercus suber]|uniref:Bifunctional epoxide hydrolase 2 n=1 Tax=Quercus suber TaxID=58331 RepID=A0AAW0KWK4_QUESU
MEKIERTTITSNGINMHVASIGAGPVFLVGHDWGAMVAWNFCLFRPDRIKALVNMSVVWFPRNPALNPVEESRALLANLSTEQGAHCFFTRLVLNKLISCSLIVPIG